MRPSFTFVYPIVQNRLSRKNSVRVKKESETNDPEIKNKLCADLWETYNLCVEHVSCLECADLHREIMEIHKCSIWKP
jgi:hypothetical protein